MDSKEYDDDEDDRDRTFSVDMRLFNGKEDEIDRPSGFVPRSPGIKLNLQAVAAATAKREEDKQEEEDNIQEEEVLVSILYI